jgi:hypothetical protein
VRFCVTNISISGSLSRASNFSLYLCEELEFVARGDILSMKNYCSSVKLLVIFSIMEVFFTFT